MCKWHLQKLKESEIYTCQSEGNMKMILIKFNARENDRCKHERNTCENKGVPK